MLWASASGPVRIATTSGLAAAAGRATSGSSRMRSSTLPARNPARSRISLSTTCLPSSIAASGALRAAARADEERNGRHRHQQEQRQDDEGDGVDRRRVLLVADVVAVVGEDRKR